MVELEQSYLDRRAPGEQPVHFVRTDHDPIVALDESERVLRELHGSFRTVTFPLRYHYLEFSPVRRDYWDWLAETTVPVEPPERKP